MLYGTLKQQEDILKEAKKYAKEKEMILIFGAMVGSVSKGCQYADSDYDTRFLYLRKDFPNKICIPEQMKEDELVQRYYLEDKVFEWIPFWEATSFFQFLDIPSFLNDFSVGLYNIVGWTLQSPYIWDPYGLQSKLLPLINTIFNPSYEVLYHKQIIQKYKEQLNENRIIVKSYLYSVHAAATIEWSIKYNQQPPVDLQTLLYGLHHKDIWNEIYMMLTDARKRSQNEYKKGLTKLHGTHFEIMTEFNERVDTYIKYAEKLRCEEEPIQNQHEKAQAILKDIYDIIYHSVFEKQNLLYRGM